MAKITWSLDVKAESMQGTVTTKISNSVTEVETIGASEMKPEVVLDPNDHACIGIHDGSSKDLAFLLIKPDFVLEIPAKDRATVWNGVEYAFTEAAVDKLPEGDATKAADDNTGWRALSGPQLFVNGAAQWLGGSGQRLWVRNKAKYPLRVVVVIGKNDFKINLKQP